MRNVIWCFLCLILTSRSRVAETWWDLHYILFSKYTCTWISNMTTGLCSMYCKSHNRINNTKHDKVTSHHDLITCTKHRPEWEVLHPPSHPPPQKNIPLRPTTKVGFQAVFIMSLLTASLTCYGSKIFWLIESVVFSWAYSKSSQCFSWSGKIFKL